MLSNVVGAFDERDLAPVLIYQMYAVAMLYLVVWQKAAAQWKVDCLWAWQQSTNMLTTQPRPWT